MRADFPRDQILTIPFVRGFPQDGRVLYLLPYFEPNAREWQLYIPGGTGVTCPYLEAQPHVGSYLANEPEDPSRDLEFPLGTLILRHLSFETVLEPLRKLENSVHRCAAILEKYHLFWSLRSAQGRDVQLLVQSELEYMFLLLRSWYDILQQLVRLLMERFVRLDDQSRRIVQDLPREFSSVVLRKGARRSAADLRHEFGLPEHLARWYDAEASFFIVLREVRDAIAHHGRTSPTVFAVPWGFAIDPSEEPWRRFGEWPLGALWEGKLGALRSAFAGFISHALSASSRFAAAVRAISQLPEPLTTDVRFFIRNPSGARLINLVAIREQPWEGLESGKEAS